MLYFEDFFDDDYNDIIVRVEKSKKYFDFTSDVSTVYPYNTGGNRIANVTVSVKNAYGLPSSGEKIKLETKVVPYSGGHNHHSDSRPVGSFASSLITTTTEGIATTTWKASGISGEEWLYAKLLNSDGEVVLTDSLKMTIKVPDLFSLESVSNDYVFYGGDNNLVHHSDHHYGTTSVCSKIKNIAALYIKQYPGRKIKINDMSLIWGGLFDCESHETNEWRTPHATHRKGTNADIDDHTDDDKIVDDVKFRLILADPTVKVSNILFHNGHYHITF